MKSIDDQASGIVDSAGQVWLCYPKTPHAIIKPANSPLCGGQFKSRINLFKKSILCEKTAWTVLLCNACYRLTPTD